MSGSASCVSWDVTKAALISWLAGICSVLLYACAGEVEVGEGIRFLFREVEDLDFDGKGERVCVLERIDWMNESIVEGRVML